MPYRKQRNKTAHTGICATRFECDRNRASTSARGFLSCQKHVLPLAHPAPSRGGNHFRPLDPRRPSRRRAFGEYGSALTILPSEPPRVSTGMIYAAAFHIFHCFQVFGSICKIKFVMREHPALPTPLPPFSVPRVTPRHPRTPSSPPFAARTRVDAYGRSISSRAETPKPDVVRRFSTSTKLSFFSRRLLESFLDKSTSESRR